MQLLHLISGSIDKIQNLPPYTNEKGVNALLDQCLGFMSDLNFVQATGEKVNEKESAKRASNKIRGCGAAAQGLTA